MQHPPLSLSLSLMSINLHLASLGCINQTVLGGSVCAACQQAAVPPATLLLPAGRLRLAS